MGFLSQIATPEAVSLNPVDCLFAKANEHTITLLAMLYAANVLVTHGDNRALSVVVRRLREFPLIEIGAHGLHHRSLPHLSPESRHRDVFESRSALERLTAGPATSLAYPFGDVSPDAVETVMSAGFQVAVSCETRGLRAREHPLRIPRLMAREEPGNELPERLPQTPID